jgi:predicted transcriptional regulator
MKPEDAEEFTQSLGQIVAGSYRQILLAQRLGVPKALGLELDEWVQTRLGGYVRLSIKERREAVKELTSEGLSQREIGAVLGVDQSTVHADLKSDGSSSNKAKAKAKSDENSSIPERDEAKIQAEALQQERVVRAIHLYTVLSTLAIAHESPSENAAELLDYDQRTFKTSQLEITSKIWEKAILTLKECAKQWKAKHASTGRNNIRDTD